jgi:hypothetical protein
VTESTGKPTITIYTENSEGRPDVVLYTMQAYDTQDCVLYASFRVDGTIVTISKSGILRLWHSESKKPIQRCSISRFPIGISDICTLTDSRLVLSLPASQSFWCLDFTDLASIILEEVPSRCGFNIVCLAGAGDQVVTGHLSGMHVFYRDISGDPKVVTYESVVRASLDTGAVVKIAMGWASRYVVSVQENATDPSISFIINVWTADGDPIHGNYYPRSENPYTVDSVAMSVSSSPKVVYLGLCSGCIHAVLYAEDSDGNPKEARTDQIVQVDRNIEMQSICPILVSMDGSRLIAGGTRLDGKSIYMLWFDGENLRRASFVDKPYNTRTALAITGDAGCVAVGSLDGKLSVFSIEDMFQFDIDFVATYWEVRAEVRAVLEVVVTAVVEDGLKQLSVDDEL